MVTAPVHHPTRKVRPGDAVRARELTTIAGTPVAVPDRDHLVHLQFRRFAGCPVCHLHLRSFVRRHDEVTGAGVREVVVFHSTAEDLRPHAGDLPFAVIADPDKRLYVEFGVESSLRALLDPRAWPGIVLGVLHSLGDVVRRRRPAPSLVPAGGRYGLPADLLIDRDGRVLAAKYGRHADDQWSVDELLGLLASTGTAACSPSP
jgi:peroxiredoxin